MQETAKKCFYSLVRISQLSHVWLCNPMNRSTPGLPDHHQLPEFTETHVHLVWCHPAISSSVVPFSSCLQSFPTSGSFQMSQLFASGPVTKMLEFQLQNQSFQWTPRTDFLEDGLVGFPCSPRDCQESLTPQFKSINSSALSFLYNPTLTSIHTWPLEKP